MASTTMWASDELLDALHDRKQRGESYEDVVWRLMETQESTERVPVYNRMEQDILVEVGGVPAKLHPEQEIYIRPREDFKDD